MEIDNTFNARMIENNLKAKDREEKRLKQSCKDFEAIYIGLMLKSMRSTVPEDSLFGTSNQKEIFQSMFDQEIAKNIANSDKPFGLGEMMYRKLVHENNE